MGGVCRPQIGGAYRAQMHMHIGPKWGSKQGPNGGTNRAQIGEHKRQTHVYVGPV